MNETEQGVLDRVAAVVQADENEEYRHQWIRDAVGEPEEVVRAAVIEGGGTFAVTERDGKQFAITRVLDMDRVCVRVKGGIVTHAHYG